MPNIEVIEGPLVHEVLDQVSSSPESIMVSPLDLAFSQNVIYLRFTDGKSVDDAVWQIRHRKATDDENCDIVLQPPFPMIEILKWRPKLRDGDGKPLLDSQGGNKFGTERSFSLDNRRLYALQRAAIAHYPKKMPRSCFGNNLSCQNHSTHEKVSDTHKWPLNHHY